MRGSKSAAQFPHRFGTMHQGPLGPFAGGNSIFKIVSSDEMVIDTFLFPFTKRARRVGYGVEHIRKPLANFMTEGRLAGT